MARIYNLKNQTYWNLSISTINFFYVVEQNFWFEIELRIRNTENYWDWVVKNRAQYIHFPKLPTLVWSCL